MLNYVDTTNLSKDIEMIYNALGGMRLIGILPPAIAYTEDFELLYSCVCRKYPLSRDSVFRELMSLWSAGRCRQTDWSMNGLLIEVWIGGNNNRKEFVTSLSEVLEIAKKSDYVVIRGSNEGKKT